MTFVQDSDYTTYPCTRDCDFAQSFLFVFPIICFSNYFCFFLIIINELHPFDPLVFHRVCLLLIFLFFVPNYIFIYLFLQLFFVFIFTNKRTKTQKPKTKDQSQRKTSAFPSRFFVFFCFYGICLATFFVIRFLRT